MRTPSNLACHEFMGLLVKVVDLSSGFTTASGRIVWETRNTFTIVSEKGRRLTVPKQNKKFVFKLDDADVSLDGDSILYRPEERTRRVDP